MRRKALILAALASAGQGAVFTPVQVQKIFFLIDRKAGHLVGGPHFHFEPYDYGPFDNAVYDEIEQMALADAVVVDRSGRHKKFSLTVEGFRQGAAELATLGRPTETFIQQTVAWVRGLRFDQLVAAIYREYPDMKAKSIFNQ